METLRETLARRLRELMGAHLGMDTQVKVAAKSGVSQSTVQRILARDQAATVDLLEQLASAFGIKRAQHLLLDADELELLAAWSKLAKQDKDRVLGYLYVTSQQALGHNAPLLSFTSSSDAPPALRAAITRDAGKPKSGGESNQKQPHAHHGPKRRRS